MVIEYVVRGCVGNGYFKGCAFCIADKDPEKERCPAHNTSAVGNSPKKHKAEPATAPRKDWKVQRYLTDPPSVDALAWDNL